MLFLDSDDYYRDDALQAIADRIAGDDLDQLYFAAETFYENRTLRRTRYEDQESRVSIDGVMSGSICTWRSKRRRRFGRRRACMPSDVP